MLLSSGQVSALISSSIVFSFTVILFASGLFLQHQSVKKLNHVLHPPGGRRGPWEQLVSRAEYALERERIAQLEAQEALKQPEEEEREEQETQPTDDRAPWGRRAYVQVVRHPSEICNALMGVTSLSIQGSPARRVLVHPSSWRDNGTGELRDTPENELLRIGAREHLLELIDTDILDNDARNTQDPSSESTESAAPSAIEFLLGLEAFDRLLYLQPDGMVLNATRLDTLFDMEVDTPVASVNRGRAIGAPALLVLPGSAIGDDIETQSSDLDLHGTEEFDPRNRRLGYTTVETTWSLARMQSAFNVAVDDNPLEKIGYVRTLTEEEEDAMEELKELRGEEREESEGTSELRRRGGATIPQAMMQHNSLVYEFKTGYDRHRETVCGATLSLIRQV